MDPDLADDDDADLYDHLEEDLDDPDRDLPHPLEENDEDERAGDQAGEEATQTQEEDDIDAQEPRFCFSGSCC